jgi:hypothetical protein
MVKTDLSSKQGKGCSLNEMHFALHEVLYIANVIINCLVSFIRITRGLPMF